MNANPRTVLLINFGHALDHLFMLIFPTAVLGMTVEFDRPYGELLPLTLGGFIAFGAGSLPAGWLGDRWSRRGMMILFFIGIGCASILAGFARTTTEIAICLTLIGLFAAIYHPVGTAMLMSNTDRIGRTLGVNGVWGNLGVAFAALIAGALTQLLGWRAAFIAPGFIAILGGIAFMVLVPASPAGAVMKRAAPTGIARSLVVRAFIVLTVATICNGVIFNATTIAMPKIFDERLTALIGSPLGIGVLVCFVYVIAAMAQLCVGYMIDHHPLRRAFVPLAAIQVPLLFVAGLTENWLMLATAVTMMFVVFGLIPINDAIVAQYIDDGWRSRIYSIRYVMSFGASAASVPLVAVLHRATGEFETLFVILAALGAVTFVAALGFPRESPGRPAALAPVPARP